MSTCTLADPGVVAGWPALRSADPFGRVSGDGDPMGGSTFDLVPVYDGPHSLTIRLGEALPSGAGLAWHTDGVTLKHDGTILLGALTLGPGVSFWGGLTAPAAISNPEPLDDPARYTNPQQPWGGTFSAQSAAGIRIDNYALWYPGASAAKNNQWRVVIDPAGTGNFTLTVTTLGNKKKPDGTYTTAPIPVGASLDAVTTALRALPNVGNSSTNPARSNGKALGTVGSYDLVFEAGAFADEIYVTSITTTGPVLSVSSRPNVFGGEGSAMQFQDCTDVVIRKLDVRNFLGDGVKFGGSCYDIAVANSTIWASDGRAPVGGHNDGFIPKGVDNRTSKRYAMDLCIVRMVSGNSAIFMSGGQTAIGCQMVVVKRTLIMGTNKALAQNSRTVAPLNSDSGASDCWIDSTQITDAQAHDSGSGGGVHGVPPEYVWQNVRRSDPQGADPRGFIVPPGTKPGIVWKPEPAGMVSVCSGTPPPDTTPPSTPTGLAAVPGVGYVDLSWTASTDT